MEYDELNGKISHLVDLTAPAGRHNWREVWDCIKEIGQAFKAIRFPKPDDRKAAWDRFQGIVQEVKNQQSAEHEASEQAKREITQSLDHLERDAQAATQGVVPWHQVWGQIKSIREEFRQIRFPSKEDREAAWKRLNKIADEASAERERRQAWKDESSHLKCQVMGHAEAARPISGIGSLGLAFLAPIIVIEGLIDTIFELITGEHFDRAKDELQKMSRAIADAWREFGEYKDQMSGRDKHEVYDFLTKVQNEVNAAWAEYKGKRAEAADERRRVWREGVESRIEKNENWLDDLQEKLQKRREHMENLQEQRDSAWSDSFRERVQGWIQEAEEQIETLETKIDHVQGWLAEDRAKLS